MEPHTPARAGKALTTTPGRSKVSHLAVAYGAGVILQLKPRISTLLSTELFSQGQKGRLCQRQTRREGQRRAQSHRHL